MKTEKLTIFVVEDSPVVLETISRELQRTIHCNIRSFETAEDCIYQLEDAPPDLIVCDYYLDPLFQHKMNGDQMLARIKKTHPDVPVIMYSSQNSVDLVVRLMKLGAADFVPKEKNFIKEISNITMLQIKKLKFEYEMKWVGRGLLFMLLLLVATLLAVHAYDPKLLPYFFIGGPIVIALWAMAVNGRQATNPHSKDAR